MIHSFVSYISRTSSEFLLNARLDTYQTECNCSKLDFVAVFFSQYSSILILLRFFLFFAIRTFVQWKEGEKNILVIVTIVILLAVCIGVFLMHFAVSCCFGQRRPFRSLTVPRRRRRRRHCTRRLSTIYHSSWCFLIRLLFMFFSPISPPKLIAEHCATFHNFCKLWSILKHYRSLSSDVDNDISNICEKMRIEIARENRLM